MVKAQARRTAEPGGGFQRNRSFQGFFLLVEMIYLYIYIYILCIYIYVFFMYIYLFFMYIYIYIFNVYIYIYYVYTYIGIALYYAYGPFGTFKFPSSNFFGVIQTRVRRIQELEEQNALLQRSFEGRVRSSKLRDKHRQQDGFLMGATLYAS